VNIPTQAKSGLEWATRPKIVSREEWLAARRQLLTEESAS